MNLAIDGYEANVKERVGIGRFAYELIVAIARHQNRQNLLFEQVRVYVPGSVATHMPRETRNFRYRAVPLKQLWTFVGFPTALTLDRPQPDVIFSPTHYIPRFVKVPRVMAIMDVSYLTYPELFLPQDLHKLIYWTAYSVRHAAKIITISEFSKHAIIEAYHIPETKVVVAYPGFVMEKGTKISSVSKRYILSVGTLQPRKNFTRLIEAFGMLEDQEIELVIVGKKGWLYEEILAAPKKFGVSDRVRFLDFVDDCKLPSLYTNAECFALPSLYEGFGLPVLEAMVQGIPVVVSKTSSLPEIAGKAGIYVDPSDTKSITEGLAKALKEKDTKVGIERVALGLTLTKRFTWDAAAEKVMNALEEVGNR